MGDFQGCTNFILLLPVELRIQPKLMKFCCFVIETPPIAEQLFVTDKVTEGAQLAEWLDPSGPQVTNAICNELEKGKDHQDEFDDAGHHKQH